MLWNQKLNDALSFFEDSEDAQDLAEYALILVFVVVVCVAGVTTLGSTVIQVYLDTVLGIFS